MVAYDWENLIVFVCAYTIVLTSLEGNGKVKLETVGLSCGLKL